MKRSFRVLLAGSVFATGLASGSAACAEDWVSLEQTAPALLFGEKCGMCHREGGMGTGILARRYSAGSADSADSADSAIASGGSADLALLENRRDLQAVLIESAVRTGIGIMFPLSRAELSDSQLQVLVEYLVNNGTAAAKEQ